jgi:hypothetical protein
MPTVSRETAGQFHDHGPAGKEWSDVRSGQHFSFTSVSEDADLTPLLQGLPNDQCQCPHWGYVVKGEIWFRFGDREETCRAGDAYYAPPGHTAGAQAGSEFLVISPEAEMKTLREHLERRAQELQAGVH